MCKEMPVIPVNRVVDKIRIIGKMEGRRKGEAQGVADPKNTLLKRSTQTANPRILPAVIMLLAYSATSLAITYAFITISCCSPAPAFEYRRPMSCGQCYD
jgi:hypothetical protein